MVEPHQRVFKCKNSYAGYEMERQNLSLTVLKFISSGSLAGIVIFYLCLCIPIILCTISGGLFISSNLTLGIVLVVISIFPCFIGWALGILPVLACTILIFVECIYFAEDETIKESQSM
jgi:hypothetical protein